MTAANDIPDQEWGKLAELEASDREARIVARFNELAGLPLEERQRRLRTIAEVEYSLPDVELRLLTLARLRSLLHMDSERASSVITAYDAVMQKMPANAAMRRVGLVQTLVIEFSAEDDERLREMIPTVFAGAPRRSLGLETDSSDSAFTVTSGVKKRRWWAFWQKA